jgi:5-formyltetrahydrofolate cyclo-ligase
MHDRIKGFTQAEIERWGNEIQHRLADSEIFQKASSIAIYASYRNEVNTQFLFEQAKQKRKRIAYPKVEDAKGELIFYWVDSESDLVVSKWGPLAPDSSRLERAPLASIDLMIIPGIAFDLQGGRLGRGKGFYDRTLQKFSGIRMGIAYAFQVLEQLPHQPWDEPVQWLATEDQLLVLRGR